MAIKRANVKEESMESMGKLRSNPMGGKMRNSKKKKPMPKKKK